MGQDQTNGGCNGFANWETYTVSLWMNNDQATYSAVRELVADGEDYDAADRLKEWVGESNPLADQPSMWSDLLNAAFSEVVWVEIVRQFRDE